MSFKEKSIRQWDESDYIEAHIELWTRIRDIWEHMSPFIDLLDIKESVVQEMTPELKPLNACYLCECYFTNECKGCPLKVHKSLLCHPNYYELSYNGYNKEYIEEIIALARQMLHKNKVEGDSNVKQS